jgi:hypothetical protein
LIKQKFSNFSEKQLERLAYLITFIVGVLCGLIYYLFFNPKEPFFLLCILGFLAAAAATAVAFKVPQLIIPGLGLLIYSGIKGNELAFFVLFSGIVGIITIAITMVIIPNERKTADYESLNTAVIHKALPIQERVTKALEMDNVQKVNVLIEALEDNHDHTRLDAIRALGEIKDSRAVEPLIERLLKDKEDYIRWNAAEALGTIKDTRAISPLIIALKDNYQLVQKDAAKALGSITGKDFGHDPIQWQKWWEENKIKSL